jgi:hypothetical protein
MLLSWLIHLKHMHILLSLFYLTSSLSITGAETDTDQQPMPQPLRYLSPYHAQTDPGRAWQVDLSPTYQAVHKQTRSPSSTANTLIDRFSRLDYLKLVCCGALLTCCNGICICCDKLCTHCCCCCQSSKDS